MAGYEMPQAVVEKVVAILLELATEANDDEVRLSAAVTLLHAYSGPAPEADFSDLELGDDVLEKLADDIARRIKA